MATFNQPPVEKARPSKQNKPNPDPPLNMDLRPCPLCKGISFIHNETGGYYCQSCQPGIIGKIVISGGPERITIQQKKSSMEPIVSTRRANQEKKYFRAAYPWIKKHLPELFAAGWNRAALFRCSQYRWPLGAWGIAWLSVWSKTQLTVSIENNGEIIFNLNPAVSFFSVPLIHSVPRCR